MKPVYFYIVLFTLACINAIILYKVILPFKVDALFVHKNVVAKLDVFYVTAFLSSLLLLGISLHRYWNYSDSNLFFRALAFSAIATYVTLAYVPSYEYHSTLIPFREFIKWQVPVYFFVFMIVNYKKKKPREKY